METTLSTKQDASVTLAKRGRFSYSITPSNEPIVKQIETLVDKILASKHPVPSGHPSIRGEYPQSDTNDLEREIDNLVYKLYDLTEEEIKIIENGR